MQISGILNMDRNERDFEQVIKYKHTMGVYKEGIV